MTLLKTTTVLDSLLLRFSKNRRALAFSPWPNEPKSLYMKLRTKLFCTSVISALFTLAVSPVLHAEAAPASLPVQAIAFIPFQKLISKVQETFSNQAFSFSDSQPGFHSQSADGSIQVASERVDLAVQVQMKAIKSTQANSVDLQLQLQNANVAAYNLNLVITIKKDLGFGIATLTYNMQCQQAQLKLNNQNTISSEVVFQQGHATASGIGWDLSNTAVSTTLVGCNEIPGLEEEIKTQIKVLVQQSFVLDGIKTLVNSKLDKVINDKITEQINTYAKSVNLSATPSHAFDDKNNLWIYSNDSVQSSFQATELLELAKSTQPSLLLKKSGIESLVKDTINQYLSRATISSKTTTGLQKLTCSRFVQFFIWPALRSLNRCFELKIQNQVKTVKIDNLQKLEMNIDLSSWASGDNRNLAYGTSLVSIKPLEAAASVINFDVHQDPAFTSWSGHSNHISSRSFKSTLQALMNQTLQVLGKSEAFGFFKQKTSVKLISADAIIMSLN